MKPLGSAKKSVESRVLAAIRRKGAGACFTPRDFLRMGNAEAAWKALARLERQGIIRRLARGLYDYPRRHPELGSLSPEPAAVAAAIASRDASKIQPTGAFAANLLGLSDHVPAKAVFLTDGPSRRIKIGKREIVLQHTVPRNVAAAGRSSGTVIQALRHVGAENLAPETLDDLGRRLGPDGRRQLWNDRHLAPQRIMPAILRICGGDR